MDNMMINIFKSDDGYVVRIFQFGKKEIAREFETAEDVANYIIKFIVGEA